MNLEDPEVSFNRCAVAQIEDIVSTFFGIRTREPNKHLSGAPGINGPPPLVHCYTHPAGISLLGVAGEAVLIVIPKKLMVDLQRRKQIFCRTKKGNPRFGRPSPDVLSLGNREVVP